MPKWTNEQELAITESGKNILVSAGAGSGKTAVLTERVIRKLKNGTSIKNLLILTFTNNAAHEMKTRIKSAIKDAIKTNPSLKQELDYIDNAYITTFDAFSLSIVKKYHYVLNIGKDIGIIDSSIIDLKKEEVLDNIFLDLYTKKDIKFLKLVDLICTKDDKILKQYILNINNKLDLLVNKEEFLNNYINNYYNESNINNIIDDFVKLLKEQINIIKEYLNDLSSEVDSKYIDEYTKSLTPLFLSNTYEEIKNNSNINLKQLRNATDLGKTLKKEMNDLIKDINNKCYYTKEMLYEQIYSTKEYVEPIIEIIINLNKSIQEFKHKINKYEFNDISIMAINIVKNNPDIKKDLTNSFEEICVDEYQDTSDIQEYFINLINNNNVYMVGDIKQSIYRFRNANPTIFKDKYEAYSNEVNGIKIDLNKNFRSRSEVLDNINLIFNLIMDKYIGGAEYSISHNMIFGNETYINEGKTNQNYNLEILNYEYNKTYTKDEIEAFIIAKDIKNKIENNYQVYDKELKTLRNIEYKDIVILMDRGVSFDLYKKILEYFNIPTTLQKDDNIALDTVLVIIKNLISLIIKIKNKKHDQEFKYLFTSISRSYIEKINDNDLLNIFYENKFEDTELYRKCLLISTNLDNLSNTELLDNIVEYFDIFNKFITNGNIENKRIILDYLYNIFNDLNEIGYDIYDLENYFNNIIENNKQLKINMTDNTNNTVIITNIHKSKGLEYNLCYFSGYDKEFNKMELKDKIIYDNKYGIILPNYNDGLEDLITKEIVRNNYIKEDISEKIRLFYVALTRAREKMIIVTDLNKEAFTKKDNNNVITNRIRLKYKSFKDILLSIKKELTPFIKNIDINSLNITNEYKNIKSINLENFIDKTNEVIKVNEINVDKSQVINKHFSKTNNNLINKETRSNMDLGLYIHELFETIDFKNIDLSYIEDKYKIYVENFINNPLLKNIDNAKIYKEYEFIYEEDDIKYHGIIDLMLEYDNYIDIIDYKLMNINSEEYIKQLKGYKKYIENSFKKKVNLYLYSILNNEISEIQE